MRIQKDVDGTPQFFQRVLRAGFTNPILLEGAHTQWLSLGSHYTGLLVIAKGPYAGRYCQRTSTKTNSNTVQLLNDDKTEMQETLDIGLHDLCVCVQDKKTK